MIKLHIKHSRDMVTDPGFRWDLYLTHTEDSKADPVYLAYGSHAGVLAFALDLIELFSLSSVHLYCFEMGSE